MIRARNGLLVAVLLVVVVASGALLAGCKGTRGDERSSPARGQVTSAGMRDAEVQAALRKHNELRARVARGDVPRQPPAADMRRLSWDEDLAAVAQRWAEQCSYAHNPRRDDELDARTGRDEPEVGENVFAFMGTGSEPTVEDAIQSWFDEHELYTFPERSAPSTGHYTQLVWADTTKVGCGFARCARIAQAFESMPPEATGFVLVCDYTPAGNWVGEAPYTAGTACSACESGRCTGALCAP